MYDENALENYDSSKVIIILLKSLLFFMLETKKLLKDFLVDSLAKKPG